MKFLKYPRIAAAFLFFGCFVAACEGWRPAAALLKLQFGPAAVRLGASFSYGVLTAVLTVLLLTFLLGRMYCSVFCPLGILKDFLSFRKKYHYSRCLKWLRYPLAAGISGLVIYGTLFPATWLIPSSAFVVMLRHLAEPETGAFLAAWGMLILLLFFVRWNGRIYCNTLCPVGAVLSLFARFSLMKIRIRENCVHCGLCEKACKAGCIDSKTGTVDSADCVACMNCLSACKVQAITWAPPFMNKNAAAKQPGRGRRRVLIALGTAAGFGLGRFLGVRNVRKPDELKANSERRVLPPGAWAYEKFRTRCVGCGLCVGVCRGNALTLSMGEHGLDGTLQPFLDFNRGCCLEDCAECMKICPTGAIQDIGLDAKKTLRLGIGGYDPLRCRAFTGEDPCGECEKACPVKAISLVDFRGKMIPKFDDSLCIGCGACQFACPVTPKVMQVIPAVEQTFRDTHSEEENPVKNEKNETGKEGEKHEST